MAVAVAAAADRASVVLAAWGQTGVVLAAPPLQQSQPQRRIEALVSLLKANSCLCCS